MRQRDGRAVQQLRGSGREACPAAFADVYGGQQRWRGGTNNDEHGSAQRLLRTQALAYRYRGLHARNDPHSNQALLN
jgi:hypothetical protein